MENLNLKLTFMTTKTDPISYKIYHHRRWSRVSWIGLVIRSVHDNLRIKVYTDISHLALNDLNRTAYENEKNFDKE